MLIFMENFVIFIPVFMILWGLAGFIGWLGVSIVCYGLITIALISNPPLLIGWLLVSSLLAILAFVIYSNMRHCFLR